MPTIVEPTYILLRLEDFHKRNTQLCSFKKMSMFFLSETFFVSVIGSCYAFSWQTEGPSVIKFALPKWYLRTLINALTNLLLMR